MLYGKCCKWLTILNYNVVAFGGCLLYVYMGDDDDDFHDYMVTTNNFQSIKVYKLHQLERKK